MEYNELCVKFGNKLKYYRLMRGYTQEKLAEKLNVSIAFLSRIERGNSHINLKRLSEICDILGVTEGYILNGSSDSSHFYLSSEFTNTLNKASPEKQKLIYKIAKVIVDN